MRKTILEDMRNYEFETDEAGIHWIEEGIPDEACDEDIEYIASNDEVFIEVCAAFVEALRIDMKYGG